jgi:hypothetical protein
MRSDIEASGCKRVCLAEQVREFAGKIRRERRSIREMCAVENE